MTGVRTKHFHFDTISATNHLGDQTTSNLFQEHGSVRLFGNRNRSKRESWETGEREFRVTLEGRYVTIDGDGEVSEWHSKARRGNAGLLGRKGTGRDGMCLLRVGRWKMYDM
jgi:hypothetical protein